MGLDVLEYGVVHKVWFWLQSWQSIAIFCQWLNAVFVLIYHRIIMKWKINLADKSKKFIVFAINGLNIYHLNFLEY